jgi:hypothetical protein
MKKKLIAICLYILTTQAFAEVKEVNNQEIISLMQNGVPIIDIRRAEEWQRYRRNKAKQLTDIF